MNSCIHGLLTQVFLGTLQFCRNSPIVELEV